MLKNNYDEYWYHKRCFSNTAMPGIFTRKHRIKRLTTKWNSNLNQYTSFNHNRIKLFVTTCNSTNWNIISKWEDTPFISFLTLIEKITWMIWDPKLAKAVYTIKWLTGLHLENVRLKNTKIYDSPDTCKKGECSYFTSFLSQWFILVIKP